MNNEDDFGIIGATLANAFHVERVVAHGGFAIVYRGIHGGFRAPIALKCLRIPEGMSEDQRNTFLERFREEGELLFRLSAAIPEVVRPLHIDAVYLPNGALMPFLALEWLDGEGFDQVLLRNRRERRPGLDLLTLMGTLRPVAQALVRAHNFPSESGSICIVHRDLKPENLFVCNVAGAPVIKILDYGIAEVFSVAQKVAGSRAWGGMNPFTPGYGAPEQWAPDRFGASGPWTDVWGMAITMTEALAGKPAIDGEIETMRRIALDPRRRPTPRTLGATLSNEVERVFEKALAVDPRDRTRDLETFWTALESAAGLPASMGRNAPVAARPSQQRRASLAERELADAAHEASIDLDLAVAPASLRNPPRSAGDFAPAGGGARAAPSVPPPRRNLSQEAEEEELPTHDEGPASGSGPHSGPRSAPAPRSSNPAQLRGSSASFDRFTPDPPPSSARLGSSGIELGGPDRRAGSASISGFPGPASTREPLAASSSQWAARGAHASSPPSGRELASVPPARPTFESEPDAMARMKGRYQWPSILLGAAIALTLLDLVAVRVWGQPLALGPVRSFWLAGPLALAGAVTLIWKIVAEDDDG